MQLRLALERCDGGGDDDGAGEVAVLDLEHEQFILKRSCSRVQIALGVPLRFARVPPCYFLSTTASSAASKLAILRGLAPKS